MKMIDATINKVWIEAGTNDEFLACNHATVVITEELARLVSELKAVAEEHKEKLNYISAYSICDVDFFDCEDAEEPMPREGLTLHVDRFDFWFTAWVKNIGFRLETNNL